jgi:hypothetical protein
MAGPDGQVVVAGHELPGVLAMARVDGVREVEAQHLAAQRQGVGVPLERDRDPHLNHRKEFSR